MQLNQWLAVERQLKEKNSAIVRETLGIFSKDSQLRGEVKEYIPNEEDGKPLPKVEKELVTTVNERLKWTWESFIDLLDFEFARDWANTNAETCLNVGKDTTVTATFLLAMEKHLQELRKIYLQIPTRDQTKKWEPTDEANVFKNGPSITYRTEKKSVPIIMAEATKEHPAQVQMATEDITIGKFEHTIFNGAASPGDKAKWLENIDILLIRVKQARQEANKQEVDKKHKIGKMIQEFIHGAS